MEQFEALVQTCVDVILPAFRQLAEEKGNILNEPLEESSFPAQIVQLKWPTIESGEVADADVDAFVVFCASRALADGMALESDHDEAALRNAVQFAAVILDFCFHSRRYRRSPSMWSNSYFGLFSSVIDSLTWPKGLLEFWAYAESRIEWFKMCNSIDAVPVGSSNLVSYRQPLYDKLRHWNDLLTMVQNNSYLNTPLHYEMKYKLEKFVSELLPISEESNFNRSAMFSSKSSSGNPWNKTISSNTRKDSSSENVFATDFNFVQSNLIANPLEFIYRPLEFKIDLDKTLGPLLDAIFEVEEEFYRKIKISRKTVSSIDSKLNHDFPPDLELTKSNLPNYAIISQKAIHERQLYWAEFLKLDVSLSSLLQPTPFDISISHPSTLYDQMMELENDFFRKQFILQVAFTVSLIRRIVTSSDVENYYKGCHQKERPSRSINFDNLNDANCKKTISLCDHLLNNRINKFYHNRDPLFVSIIQRLVKADEQFLKSKMDGFKNFNSFVLPQETVESSEIDYSFKKFGFVLLGNKSINDVWKIKSGLDEIQTCSSSAKEVFEDLQSQWSSVEGTDNRPQARSSDMIIKDWQTLRRLRSQYLFDFNKVNEENGVRGIFRTSQSADDISKKRQSFESVMEKTREPHTRKLTAARQFTAERLKRKREQEAEHEDAVVKQRKLDDGRVISTSEEASLPEETESFKETDRQNAPEVPEEGQENQAQSNERQISSEHNEKTDEPKEAGDLHTSSDQAIAGSQ